MTAINRKFHQSWRGPGSNDLESWSLVFDAETRQLRVRHDWRASRHSGFEELEISEFLQQRGEAQAALIDSLFPALVDA